MNARNAREWTPNARVRLSLPGGRFEDPTCGARHIQTIPFDVGKATNDSRVSGVSLSIRSTRRRDVSIGGANVDTLTARADGQNTSAPSVIAFLRAAYCRPFDERMKRLTTTLREQQAEAARLDESLPPTWGGLGHGE